MRRTNRRLRSVLVLLMLMATAPLVAQTPEQKRVMYTISAEEKQCRVDRLKELMKLVETATTEAEISRYGRLADDEAINQMCAARVAATNTVNNGVVMSIFRAMVTFDRKAAKPWKSPTRVSKSCTTEILKTLKDDALMLTDFRPALVRAGCGRPLSK